MSLVVAVVFDRKTLAYQWEFLRGIGGGNEGKMLAEFAMTFNLLHYYTLWSSKVS